MKKVAILIILIFSLFLSYELGAQDNKTSLMKLDGDLNCRNTRFRIMGGPMVSYLLSGQAIEGKGIMLGFNGGMEVHQRLATRFYLIGGVSFSSTSFENWIDSSKSGNYAQVKGAFLEVPIGIGVNLGHRMPKGAFVNLSLINSFHLSSQRSEYKKAVLGSLSILDNSQTGVYNVYNFGSRLEIGYKGLLHEKYFSSFSGFAQPMFMTLGSNQNKAATLSIGLVGSIYL